MGEVVRKLEQSSRFLEIVKAGQRSCILCRFIAEDLIRNGRLTGYPLDWAMSGTFPIEGKLIHVILEVGHEPPPEDPGSLDELAAIVVRLLNPVQTSN
jgi:hypothetical protein